MPSGSSLQADVDKARQLLHRRFKVTLHSGRTLVGDFTCLDPQGNLILVNSCELVKSSSDPKGLTERTMGMVLIPRAQQAQVELQVTPTDRMAMLSLVN